MDGQRFDDLTRALGATRSRRQVLRALAGAAAAALTGAAHRRPAAAADCGRDGEPCGCCRGGLTCTNGTCCPDERACNGACCPSGHRCEGGACVRSGGGGGSPGGCPAGQANCAGPGCVDLSADPANCGACGNACPPSTNPCQVAVCANGICGFGPGNEGAPCDDGNACTQIDTCQGGACVGSSPLVCSTDNPCLTASCDPILGCVTTPKPADTPCDDANRCDGREKCDGAGSCVEGTPETCPEPGQCQEAGVCDPATGACSYQSKADGTACTGTDACFGSFACLGGACVGRDPVVCDPPADPCRQAGVCNPADGACTYAPAADGTACDDGDACTSNDQCQNGVCGGTPRPGCCVTAADCGEPFDGCEFKTCDNGLCHNRYRPAGTPCTFDDPCVTKAECTATGVANQTRCFPTETDQRDSCQYPCDTVADCQDRAGGCGEMVCEFDPVVGRGGCVVAPYADGTPCPEGGRCHCGRCETSQSTCLAVQSACSADCECCLPRDGNGVLCRENIFGEQRCCVAGTGACQLHSDCCFGLCVSDGVFRHCSG